MIRRFPARSLLWCGAISFLLAIAPVPAFAQSPESDVPEGHPPEAETHWAFPEIPDKTLDALKIDTKFFTLHWGLCVIGDYTAFQQNEGSLEQVGKQEDTKEFRSFRLMLRGQIHFLGTWTYLVSGEYKGFDRDPGDPLWNMSDVWFSRSLGSLATVRIGKQKESFVYEMVGDAANLPQAERYLSPFFTSRGVGVSLSGDYLGQRATWTVGWFNDWWVKGQSFNESGNDFAARFTFLPILSADNKHYLHLAVAGRYRQRDDGVIRMQGRPQSNVSDSYVDTGNFAANHVWNLGLEALYANGPFGVLAEYVKSWAPSEALANPSFYGWYTTVSWVFSGAPRPYDRKAGVAYARRPPVGGYPLGVVELYVRYGRVNLNDGAVAGGAMNEWYTGVNWFATKRWKLGFGYGNVDLDRFGLRGRTNIFLWRLQWIH
jgi:phosphate-selective porin